MAITDLITDRDTFTSTSGMVFTEQTEAQFIADAANTLNDEYPIGKTGNCTKVTIPTSVGTGVTCTFHTPYDFGTVDFETVPKNFQMRVYIPRTSFVSVNRNKGLSAMIKSGSGGLTAAVNRVLSIVPPDSVEASGNWVYGKNGHNSIYADPNNLSYADGNWRDTSPSAVMTAITAVGGQIDTHATTFDEDIVFWIFDCGYVTAQTECDVAFIFDDGIDNQFGATDSLQSTIRATDFPVGMSFYAPTLGVLGGVMTSDQAKEMANMPSVEVLPHGDHDSGAWPGLSNGNALIAQIQETYSWGVDNDRDILRIATAPLSNPYLLTDGSYQEDALAGAGITWCRYAGKKFFNYELGAGNPLLMYAWVLGQGASQITTLAEWQTVKAELIAIGGNMIIIGHGTVAAAPSGTDILSSIFKTIVEDAQADTAINIVPPSRMAENMGLDPFQLLSLGANGIISSFIK